MGIQLITRDWGPNPSIVRIVTTDTLATIIATGYLTAQAANIRAYNNGDFQWQSTDYCLISYNGGEGFFIPDYTTNMAFMPQGVQTAAVRVTSAQLLGMYATPVNIIPSPGTDKLIVVGRSTFVYLYGTVQYAAGGAIGLEFGNVTHGAGEPASTTLAAATFNGYAASNTFELTPDNTAVLANSSGLGVYLSNATAAFTTGDGVLIANVNYQIVPAV